jgi:hypothetical protein
MKHSEYMVHLHPGAKQPLRKPHYVITVPLWASMNPLVSSFPPPLSHTLFSLPSTTYLQLHRVMVSTRPPPQPAQGRSAYPSATAYTPGDANTSPSYQEPLARKTSRRESAADKDAQGIKTWFKGFKEVREEDDHHQHHGVFGVPLAESLVYASVHISTAGPDGELYVWG